MKEYYPEGFIINTAENRKNMASTAALAQAMADGRILEANVTMCDAEHNMMVDLGIMKGVIPRTEGAIGIAEGTTRDIALISRVGKAVSFTVSRFDTDSAGNMYALLSRRSAQQRCLKHLLENKRAGDIINARITHLESFGAFCDVGCGNVALLPIDSMSVSRISHPKDRFCVGQDIRVIIKNIDDDGKITLSHKELLGTWAQNVARFSQGQTVSGIIRSIEDYGVFVELAPNLAGLAEPHENVYIGQTASVYIKSIIPEKMKIKLIIIDSFDGEYETPTEYFYTGEHITEFNYSPPECAKQISAYF